MTGGKDLAYSHHARIPAKSRIKHFSGCLLCYSSALREEERIVKICILASSSSGNSIFIGTEQRASSSTQGSAAKRSNAPSSNRRVAGRVGRSLGHS